MDSQPRPDTAGLNSSNKATDANGNQYEAGWQTGGYQDPFVVKKNSAGQQIWKVVYETTDVDSRGLLVFVDDKNNPWVVFSVDGGSTSSEYINKKQIEQNAFSNVYAGGYGSGGGPKINIITKLNPDNGKITKGTFLMAKLSDGKTNGLGITKIGVRGDKVVFEADAVAWPPGKGKSYTRFPDITDADRINNVFKLYYEMKTDLSEITEAIIYKK